MFNHLKNWISGKAFLSVTEAEKLLKDLTEKRNANVALIKNVVKKYSDPSGAKSRAICDRCYPKNREIQEFKFPDFTTDVTQSSSGWTEQKAEEFLKKLEDLHAACEKDVPKYYHLQDDYLNDSSNMLTVDSASDDARVFCEGLGDAVFCICVNVPEGLLALVTKFLKHAKALQKVKG